MTDAKENDLESVSGAPLDTDPAPSGTGEPYDADGVIEPDDETDVDADRRDPAGDDQIDDPSLERRDGPLTEP